MTDPSHAKQQPFPDDIYVELLACLAASAFVDGNIISRCNDPARAHQIVNQIATIFWESAPDGLVEIDSPTWRTFTGQSYDDWKGYGWLTALHHDDRLVTVEKWRNTVQDERSVEAEYRLRRLDGRYQQMRVHAVPSRDQEGQITKWFGINIEIPDNEGPGDAAGIP